MWWLIILVLNLAVVVGLGFKFYVFRDLEHENWRQGVPPLLEESQGRVDKARANFGRLWDWRVTSEVGQNPARTFTRLILFFFLTALLPTFFLTGFSMKSEVATEVFTGFQGVEPWTLNIGVAVLPVTIVNVVAAGMVLVEMILGIAFHYSGERLHDSKSGEGEGEENTFKGIRIITGVFIVVLVLLEGVFGYFRGQIESQGDLIPTLFMIFTSVALSVATILVAYLWKSNLTFLMVPLRWILMVVGWGFNLPWVALSGLWWFVMRVWVFQGYLVALVCEKIDQYEPPEDRL